MTDELRFDDDTAGDLDSYTLDFTAWLAILPGDTIVSAVITVSPVGMTVDGAATIAGGLVTQFLSGGVLGTDYTVSYAITTALGRGVTRSAMLFCGTPEPVVPTTVALLGARTLRKIGVAIVADMNRPGPTAPVAAADVALAMLIQMGIPVPLANQPAPGLSASQAAVASAALRDIGVNPQQQPWPTQGSPVTSEQIARIMMIRMGIPIALRDQPIPGAPVAQADIASRALREVGVNPQPQPWPAAAAAVSADDVATVMMLRMGIPVDIADQPAVAGPVAQADIASRALEAVGANPAALTADIGTDVIYNLTDVGNGALRRLAVIASDEDPLPLDATNAALTAGAVHDILVATDFVTWGSGAIPSAALEFYIIMTMTMIATGYGKAGSPEAFTQAEAMIRQQALSGANGQAIAEAKVSTVHEELNALGLVGWALDAIPAAEAEHYVRMTAILLAPVYKTTQTAQDVAADTQSYLAAIEAVRHDGLLRGVQARASLRVGIVHEELNALGLVTWSIAAIPAFLSDLYATLAESQMTAEGGKPLTVPEYTAIVMRIRVMVLSGPLGQSLAEAKVSAVHEELNALGLVAWQITAVPLAEADHYVRLTAILLAPIYKPVPAEEATANAALYATTIAAVRHAGLLAGVEDRAATKIVTVHEELNALGFVTWTSETVPLSLSELYATLAESMMTAEGGKPLELAEYVAAVQQIRVIVLSGPLGQSLAEAKVSAVHEELNALGLVSWPLSAVPPAEIEHYVRLTAILLAPIYKPVPAEEATANAALYVATVGAVRHAALLRGVQARAVAQVGTVHEELNALSLVTWTVAAIPAALLQHYAALASAYMTAEGAKGLTPPEYAGWVQRIRLFAMGGSAGQALAEQKVRAIHYSLEARGRVRWTLFDIPDYAEEPYVFMAATLLAPECGMKADPNWYRSGEMDLMRIVSIPSNHEPVKTDYF